MNRPLILLFVLLVTVPLLVGGAGVASYLLLRAGYGVLVWGLVPFLVLLLLAGVLAVVIGKAARVKRDDDPKGER
jgi:O-antigen ligase